ncbi:1-aminocyclopropane-1-carboxylate deaminase/D-cysteine desulfhydrase [Salegentibacter salarius]|uniref:1-aminocyclopropane-1-carboxylate deaminase n=1 Tax=Salegentibacter salarius TaxID=435906 RepID=A0A2N0TRG0_9FLAO|nr:pyridoxal-phosphate dependent enzyme [Salegentibacter salarius]OEY71740.1 1-aminocyclopropane-1-carboxylate deaminase [Salegentibacter salarius]PKD17332.1 1-aminocyclopropane-1-carboxylate deaminase [Salegentibacter salarius]SLJ89541.1 1-aminocyclopropane-1-carboxylate deaminase [Salegentibacter salarius]
MPNPLNFNAEISSENQFIAEFSNGISLHLKREDLLHPEVSGNKFRKLKYNILEAQKHEKKTLLTFGGAYSNHIAATAAAGKISGLKTIGIIRGEELGQNLEKTLTQNRTLNFAHSCGMQFSFVSREDYRDKETLEFQKKLNEELSEFYLVPEGGTNQLAIKGCEEILNEKDKEFHFIAASVGTGGTLSGLINASTKNQQILGFPALKGDFLSEEIKKYSTKNNWELILNYHFAGYAKVDSHLINFINKFKEKYQIQLDPVYTGKLVFGIFDLIKTGYFPSGSKVLVIHTGGLQGIPGMNSVLKKKNLPLISY